LPLGGLDVTALVFSFTRAVALALSIALSIIGAVAGCSTDASAPDGGTVPPDAPIAPTDASIVGADGPGDAGAAGADGGEEIVEQVFGGLVPGDEVEVVLEREALGLQLVVEASDRSAQGVGIAGLIAPDGTAWITDFVPLGVAYPIAMGASFLGVAQIPASSEMPSPLPSGTYRARVDTFSLASGATLTLRARAQHARGRLDIHVWLADDLEIGRDPHPISSTTAAGDRAVRTRIDAFYDAASQLGLDRGTVAFHPLDPSFRTIDDYEELRLAAEATSGERTAGAHFVWTNGITLEGRQAWGVTTGIPGIAAQPGTSLSAVALDVSTGISEIGDGWTMAHELGHFGGLFHTSELGGDSFDAISDTAECTAEQERGRSCPDRRNLMYPLFWGASGGVDIEVSPEQRRIVAGNLFARPAREGEAEDAASSPEAAPPDGARAGHLLLEALIARPAGHLLLADACGHAPRRAPGALTRAERRARIEELDALAPHIAGSGFLVRRAELLRRALE
jgi:hypothetical protein